MTAYLETGAGLMVPRNGHALAESDRAFALTVEFLEARIGELEARLQEQGWLRLDGDAGREFSREAIGNICDLARVMYLKNPLVKRAVEIGALYVWGQDLTVNAADTAVRAVVDRFWKDNRATLTGQQASRLMEVELEVTGNLFLALFPDPATGAVAVRQVPMEEFREIVTNPEDRADVWYYRREWTERAIDGTTPVKKTALHPDWRYRPADQPASLPVGTTGETIPIRWDAPVLHMKVGAFPHWRWGVSEVYAALDWARAYKELLEDDATRSRALARFAWSLTTKGGRAGVAAAKTKLATTLGSNGGETNPPPVSGSTAILGEGTDLKPLSIANAMLPPDHSRPARLMASAALGTPDHFFDADVGNFATSKTLDRPTELRFNERRQMWRDVLMDLLQWVIDRAIEAPRGGLPAGGLDEKTRTVDLSWPDLLEKDVGQRVTAVVDAATLSGRDSAGTISEETVSRLLVVALGVDDVDGELKKVAAEQAERDAKAAEIAKQTARQPQPPAVPVQPTNGRVPTTPTESLTEVKAVEIGEDELADAVAWWDARFPELKGAVR